MESFREVIETHQSLNEQVDTLLEVSWTFRVYLFSLLFFFNVCMCVGSPPERVEEGQYSSQVFTGIRTV